jgi:hypothetical protein
MTNGIANRQLLIELKIVNRALSIEQARRLGLLPPHLTPYIQRLTVAQGLWY